MSTLRALYGLLPPRRITATTSALVLVDFQREFFDGGLPVPGGQAALKRAAALLGWARHNALSVVHVRNVITRVDSPLFAATSPTIALMPELMPDAGELLVTKERAGAFTSTDLDALLRARSIDTLLVAGIMTHLAVDTTVRDAAVLGYHVLVAADACATRALPCPLRAGTIAAEAIHSATLAALSDRFADVLRAEQIMALPVTS